MFFYIFIDVVLGAAILSDATKCKKVASACGKCFGGVCLDRAAQF
jgi:hypothetical protein